MASTLTHLESDRVSVGAIPISEWCTRFSVWAPSPQRIELHLVSPEERLVALHRDADGMCCADVEGVGEGARYFFRIDGKDRPDPASRYQPEGVHGPSQVVNFTPDRDVGSARLPLSEYVVYELHVGTFTPEGTLDAIIPELPRLAALGITAVELMPVAEFPGDRNWGYDGVCPYAVHHSYGGPNALRRLARACHEHGLALVLDVVYNHLGPEGNYLAEFGPYFTSRYRTPWGDALNFDGPGSDFVRRYFIENAFYWIGCGVDALRLDAVHAIFDHSAYPFLQELADCVHAHAQASGRAAHLIAESDLNDERLVLPRERKGMGLDAQWSDDFHHSLHTLVTGQREGYYQDFGDLAQMAEALRCGWVYAGQFSPFRQRRHGSSPADVRGRQIVVYSQNHDQIGNRVNGERLIQLAGFSAAKLAAATVIFSPFIPMLFMGEEYGDPAPFLYFVSHSDPELVEAVCLGRRQEFPGMISDADFPQPQDENTFLRSKLQRNLMSEKRHAQLCDFYKELLRLRRTRPELRFPSKTSADVQLAEAAGVIVLHRWRDGKETIALLHFGSNRAAMRLRLPAGHWSKRVDSHETQWGGPGSMVPDEICSAAGDVELVLGKFQAVALTLNADQYARTNDSSA